MDRRLFLTGLLGVAGTAALITAMPRDAQALAIGPTDDTTPDTGILPELEAASEEVSGAEGVDVAWHRGYRHRRRRRRRVRRRRYRRICRRYRNRWGHWVRRCRRQPYWFWLWI